LKLPKDKLHRKFLNIFSWFDRYLPAGGRTIVGLLLIIGGMFGFLPILGFWMIPLGLGVIALDIRWLRKKVFRRRK